MLACLTALQNKLKMPSATNKVNSDNIACGGNCSSCSGSACAANHGLIEAKKAAQKAQKAAASKAAAMQKEKAKMEVNESMGKDNKTGKEK